MRFTIATYNIHKGFTQLNRRMVIHELRERLHGLAADILLLQEVVGVHRGHAARHVDWPLKPQHEFIADTVWHEVAYGKNAVSHHGHHGNAVLSRFPIVAQENLDISAHAFESRGLLHCTIDLGPGEPSSTASTSTWGSSSAGGSGRSTRCASGSARRCRPTRRSSSPAISTTGGTRPTGCSSTSSASSRCSPRCAGARRARFLR